MCLVLASKFAIICYAVMENQYEYSYLGDDPAGRRLHLGPDQAIVRQLTQGVP